MAKLPAPPRPLTTPPDLETLPRGSILWRIYSTAGAHPVAWKDFRHYGPTNSRFDHHEDPARVQARGILYAASSPITCLAEVYQATRVIHRTRGGPWLVGFEIQRDVSLLNLRGAWPTRAGASMAINSGPRPRARPWSRAIYDAYPAVEGLLYASSMYGNQPAFALYERAQSALPGAPSFHRALWDTALWRHLDAAATELGYRLV